MVKFFGLLVLGIILFFVQQQRLLSINDINPDLIFIFLTTVAFFHIFSFPLFIFFLFLCFIIISFLTGGFWLFPILVLNFLVLIVYFLKFRFSRNLFWNFLMVLIGAHFVFYFIINITHLADWHWFIILGELVYNLVWGGLMFVFFYEKKSTS